MRLCRLAAEISAFAPWRYMGELQTVAVIHRKGGQPDFISVLGALGEHRAIHVYPGVAGYHWLRRVVESDDSWRLRLLLTECEALQAAYADPDELTDPDLDLLRGCRFPPSEWTFQFRSVRRGYLPWYLCEEEGKRLAACLDAFVQALSSPVFEDPDYWWPDEAGAMPLLSRQQGRWGVARIQLRVALEDQGHLRVSEEWIARLPRRRSGVLCLGDHLMQGAAGLENERPIVLHLLAAVDAESGFAYEPKLREPGEILAFAAAEVLVKTIEARGAVPERVLVPAPYYERCLKPVAEAAGFTIQVRRSLPALDELFRSLDRFERRGREGRPDPV